MKTKLIILSLLFLLFALPSCESNREIGGDPTPLMFVTVIKMASPEYLNFVVVEKDSRDPGRLCRMRSSGATCQDFYLGSSPYIPLPNDYYLVDWKWGTFIYEPTNFLINVKWADVTNRYQTWEYNSYSISSHFLKEWAPVAYKNIDKYLCITPPTRIDSLRSTYIPSDYVRPNWIHRYNFLNDIPDTLKEAYQAGVKYQDSLQDVYRERISQIIEQNALDKVGHTYIY